VAAHNVRITCGGVAVDPGDLVLADHDGIVVIPHAAAEETLANAEEKVRGENLVRKALEGGMSTKDAFKKYGVL
jgi:regulator of RNase E activity RraA